MEASKRRLAGDTDGEATSNETESNRRENRRLGSLLLCLTGLPGVGKSRVAKTLHDVLRARGGATLSSPDCLRISTDDVRYWLYPELVDSRQEMGRDFSAEELERSYSGLCSVFDALLGFNPNLFLIADGTFRQRAQRAAMRAVARKHGSEFVVIKVEAEEKILLPRLDKRLGSGQGAGAGSYFAAKAAYEEPAGDDVICLVNEGSQAGLESHIRQLVSGIFAARKESQEAAQRLSSQGLRGALPRPR